MALPPLCQLPSIDEYRIRFETTYCQGSISTFDGIGVRFKKSDFDHCFFESSHRDGVKDQFSIKRSERIDWIKAALQDANADLFKGWNSQKKRYDGTRRVCLVSGNYVVVNAITGQYTARFITAFVADTPRTLARLLSSPKWTV